MDTTSQFTTIYALFTGIYSTSKIIQSAPTARARINAILTACADFDKGSELLRTAQQKPHLAGGQLGRNKRDTEQFLSTKDQVMRWAKALIQIGICIGFTRASTQTNASKHSRHRWRKKDEFSQLHKAVHFHPAPG